MIAHERDSLLGTASRSGGIAAPIGTEAARRSADYSYLRPLVTNNIGAGRLLSCGQTKIWQLKKAGLLDIVQVGGRAMITMASIERLAAGAA